ncbi:MAG: ABC transporter substrate-binding protein [Thermodesulfobacteriota bacterium]|nr:ABC transporter substrate-binding protein [Thermodesulfobacteriota bacterium]
MSRFAISSSLVILLAALGVSCEGLGVPTATDRTRNENILHYDVNAPFTSLNPAQFELSGSNHVFPLLYGFLVVPNCDGKLEADLARKWSYDSKSFTWTIYLQENALFHNKEPVTSKDVQYSFQTVLKKHHPSLSSLVEKISLLSDTILSIVLTRDEPDFLFKIWDMAVIHQSNNGKTDYYNHPVGSGPFRFQCRKGGSEVGLVANEDYFRGRPALDGVIFHFQPDKEKTWTRLLSGKTDVGHEISPRNYEVIHQCENRYYFDTYHLPCYTILLYNTTDPLFSATSVRLALSLAIDREYIVENILKGLGIVAEGPMGVGSPFHNPEVMPIRYEPQKGLKLLKGAGWSYDEAGRHLVKDGKRFEFTILVFEEGQIERKVAEYIRLCLNDLGIIAQVKSLPFLDLKRRYLADTAFEAVITDFRGAYRNPEYLSKQWCMCIDKGSEAGCFHHPEVTHLLRKAIDEKDPLKQKQLLYQTDALVSSLQPGTFLYHKKAINIMSKRFKLTPPFSLTYQGIYNLRQVSLNPIY